ncbi:uncharacterized protein LOC124432329 isoform X1 [Vespa crabro]|uniref:uncharacterized protein LOC124432329 isoform X1 n=1 Tax=Vespa crabro TaxID=7445 RepID=UPI001EFFD8BB|nr:uncharacterized protein LOC124432329 isoform X1 [Vespa crabro]
MPTFMRINFRSKHFDFSDIGNNHYEKISTRNRSINARKYNIGKLRLPLADVQEITEYEDSTDDNFTLTNKSKEAPFKNNKLGWNKNSSGEKLFNKKAKKNQIIKKEDSSAYSIDSVSSAKLPVRLRGGTDFFRSSLKTKGFIDNNKNHNLRSRNTQKPIIPRKQSELNYHNLQESDNGKEKNTLPTKLSSSQEKKQSIQQTKTLKNVSKLTVLLLYLHFLLSYYLSFSKSQRFEEMFEMCETETRYE